MPFREQEHLMISYLESPNCFKIPLITTNYDRTIELAFDTGPGEETQIIGGLNVLDQPDLNKTTIIKIHGNIQKPTKLHPQQESV